MIPLSMLLTLSLISPIASASPEAIPEVAPVEYANSPFAPVVQLYAQAQKSGSVKDYAAAARKFRKLLKAYPLDVQIADYEWYYADTLFNSEQFDLALQEYDRFAKNPSSPYRDGARYQILQARKQVVLSKYGKLEDMPAGQPVETTITTKFGKQVPRYTIADEQKAFMLSCDEILAQDFTDPEITKLVDDFGAAYLYLPAVILYNHGNFEEARARLERLIERFPRKKEAGLAAQVLVNTYVNEGDLERVASLVDELKSKKVGADGGDLLSTLSTIQEQAVFNLAVAKATQNDHLGASSAFLSFLQRFPRSQYSNIALFNAANQADLAGNAVDALKLFEQYVASYPADERSKDLYFRIADTYAATLDLDKAIGYYDGLVKRFPNHKDASSAMYNAAFLRVGVGDHRGAATTYELYALTYPALEDAEGTFWRAGEQWELVSDTEAMSFYSRYFDRFHNKEPNHAIEALYKLAKLQEKQGDSRSATTRTRAQYAFDAAKRGLLTSRARSLAAEGAVADLGKEFAAIKQVTWTASEEKNVEILTKTKVEQIKSLTEHAMSIISTYQEYDSMSAALYYMGAARFAYADIAFEAPPPKDLSEAELEVYRQLVDEKFRVPSEDAGRGRLQAALDKAKAEKRWSNWNSMALSAINERLPSGARSSPPETGGRAVIGALDAEYVALKAANWVASEEKNVDLMNAKLDQARALRDHARRVLAEHPQDEVAAAAEYYAGVSFLAFADLVYHMPAPNGLSADELHAYEQAVGERMVIPSEDKGREALEASLQKATQDNRWSKWHSKMLGALNDTFGAAALDQVSVNVELPFSGPLSSRPVSMDNSGESVKDVLDTADQAKLEAAVALLLVPDATQAQRALDELNLLITRHPDQAILPFNKGIAWMALADDGHAREAWERAVALDANFDSARRNIAVLDFRNGQTSDGLRNIQTGLKSNARSVDLQVAAIAALRAEMRYDEAIQQGKAALSVNSRAMPLFCELALVYIDTNQVDIAKFLIEKAIIDLGEASNAQAHATLGQIYSRKGDIGAALAEFQKALSIDPLQVSALRSLGSYYLDNRAYEDALPILTRAVAAEPRDARSHLALAIVYRELGRLGDAKKEYEAALSVHAKHPEPWRNLTVRVGSDIKVYNAALELIAQSVHSQDGSGDTAGITATGNGQSVVSNSAVDPSVVPAVVQRSKGSFQSCVEAGASRNRALAGKIVFGWSIASGRVVNISNIENSSGDAALGTCFASVIRLMRFDPSVNYRVGAYTWPISAQQAAPNTPVKATRKPAGSSDLWGDPAGY